MKNRTGFTTAATPRAAIIAAALAATIPTLSFTTTTKAADVDIVGLTAKDVATGLSLGSFTSVDLVKSFQDRISAYEPNYNAFTFFNPDALADAAALDAEYQLTGPRSPLHGVPIVIKEAMDVKGLPSTVGWTPPAKTSAPPPSPRSTS